MRCPEVQRQRKGAFAMSVDVVESKVGQNVGRPTFDCPQLSIALDLWILLDHAPMNKPAKLLIADSSRM